MLTVINLIESGFSYDAVMSFTEDEIRLIIGVQNALKQRSVDEQQRQERLDRQRNSNTQPMF